MRNILICYQTFACKSSRKSLVLEVLRMNIGNRITQIRGKASRRSFAQQIGIAENTLRNYEEGLSLPNSDTIAQICQSLAINAEWLILGTGPMRPGDTSPEAEKRPVDMSQSGGVDTELVMIPMVEARLSAGCGSLQVDSNIERSYAFRSDFLHRKGNPKNMVMMRVEGDSMQPEIINNDVVLLDQSKKDIRLGRIYAVGFEDAIYLKRIDKLPGKIVLKSVNPEYPPVELDIRGQNEDSFRVIGQVIWCGREYS